MRPRMRSINSVCAYRMMKKSFQRGAFAPKPQVSFLTYVTSSFAYSSSCCFASLSISRLLLYSKWTTVRCSSLSITCRHKRETTSLLFISSSLKAFSTCQKEIPISILYQSLTEGKMSLVHHLPHSEIHHSIIPTREFS